MRWRADCERLPDVHSTIDEATFKEDIYFWSAIAVGWIGGYLLYQWLPL